MPKIAYIVTVSMTVENLLRGQLHTVREHGFDITVFVSPSPNLAEIAAREDIQIIAVPMQREINLWADLRSLWHIYGHLRTLQPQIVNASTPKAGLLGMVAAWLVGIPQRVYVLRGLRLETTTGLRRWVLYLAERLTALCAKQVISVSHSLGDVYASLGLAPRDKLTVLGRGSSNGVIVERFQSSAIPREQVTQLREQLHLPDQAPVIGFVGRFTRDKGIFELVQAFLQLLQASPEVHLLLVGAFEEGDPVPATTREIIEQHPQIKQAGFVANTAPYYQLMDVLAFPSYREGFPNVPLEAAVAQVSTVGFEATGTVDAVVDGETGLLVDVGDVQGLSDALQQLLRDDSLRHQMGKAAQARAIQDFDAKFVWQNWLNFYQRILAETEKS